MPIFRVQGLGLLFLRVGLVVKDDRRQRTSMNSCKKARRAPDMYKSESASEKAGGPQERFRV